MPDMPLYDCEVCGRTWDQKPREDVPHTVMSPMNVIANCPGTPTRVGPAVSPNMDSEPWFTRAEMASTRAEIERLSEALIDLDEAHHAHTLAMARGYGTEHTRTQLVRTRARIDPENWGLS